MGRKRHTSEQIITALREAEVGLARGKSVKLISRAPASRRGTVATVEGLAKRTGRTPDFIERALSWGRWKCEPLAGGKLRRPRG